MNFTFLPKLLFMKCIWLLVILLIAGNTKGQNVGIGVTVPQARLDILSGNNWDLINGEGDLRLGSGNIRLKIGLATGGGGAGATGIMQYGAAGGYNVLSLGAQGSYLLQLNGNLGRVGIGTDNPTGKFEIFSTSSVPQQVLTQQSTGDFARLRLRNGNSLVNSRYWDVAAFIASTTAADDRLNFFSNNAGNVLGLAGNGAVYINGNAGTSGQVLRSAGSGGAAYWGNMPVWYTAAPNPSPYVAMVDDLPGYTFGSISHSITLPQNSLVLVSASFNAEVNSCAFCGPGLNTITLIVDGVEMTNKPYLLSGPAGGYANVTISNYPLSLGSGAHSIQFRANHITPSTTTQVQPIYSSIQVVPN